MTSSTGAPPQITAGDSAAWTLALPDYLPSAGWSLSLGLTPVVIVASAALITFTATPTADGTGYLVNVPPATTATWKPGRYFLAGYVSRGTGANAIRITAARGYVVILPDPAAAATPSHAQRTLALIESALEGRIPRGLEETTIDGQSISRIPIDTLHQLRDKYRAEVANEQRAAAAAAGIRRSPNILVRFVG